jgi:hypothetical protein
MFPEDESKKDPFLVFAEALMSGGDSNVYIGNQEKRGQSQFVRSQSLPRDMHGHRATLEAMGIVFGEIEDDLFIECTFPDGWEKRATDHSMHSKIVDEKGRERIGVFYKAAFYDRSAHCYPVRRFSYGAKPETGYDNYTYGVTPDVPYVEDCGVEIWRGEPMAPTKEIPSYKIGDILRPIAKAWLEEHYPDWEDYLAYWD